MKTLFKLLFAFAITTTAFTSCMDKDDTDYEGLQRKEESRVDSLLAAQKTEIEAYAHTEFTNPIQDTVNINLPLLNKKVKRGIWYEVVSAPTDDTYEYKIINSGTGLNLVYPKLKLKYKASLLNGTVVKSDDTGGNYDLGVNSPNVFNNVWFYSFFPYSIQWNGEDRIVGGLTRDGLKKGSIFRVVSPSYWAFDDRTVGDIGANSPLVYEFEVIEIQ